jgi:hypothetical protein
LVSLRAKLGMCQKPVTDMDVLQLGMDPGRRAGPLDVVDGSRKHEAFDPVVAVEAGTSVIDLHEPWPHRLWRRVNRDCPRVM